MFYPTRWNRRVTVSADDTAQLAACFAADYATGDAAHRTLRLAA
jgi:hypothetical protein